MPVMLFRLRGVPGDEAGEVRALLDEHEIEYYETSDGNWGISMAAIWLRDESRLSEARALIDAYQDERRSRMRAEYEQQKHDGQRHTLADFIRRKPVQFIAYLVIALVVLYWSTVPFINFLN